MGMIKGAFLRWAIQLTRLSFYLIFLFSGSEGFAHNLELPIHLKKSWMMQRIAKDLRPHATKDLSAASLKELYRSHLSKPAFMCILIEIKKNKLSYWVPTGHTFTERELAFKKVLKEIARERSLPDVTFILSTHDAFNEPYPVLTFSKRKQAITLLVPDFEALMDYQELHKTDQTCLRKEIKEASKAHPWHTKINKIFWRGSFTGGYFNKNTYRSLPRVKAVMYSSAYPELIDAKFIEKGPIDLEALAYFKAQKWVVPPIKPKDSLGYKYFLDIDGNSCCYSRTYWTLLSNSVVLKHESENIQWYYDLLEEGVHYIKIHQDFSNLLEVYTWLRTHDDEAQKIAINATNLVKNNLSNLDNKAYVYLLLKTLASLQTDVEE